MRETGNVLIDKVMANFIPANEREWYPWVWPEKEWYAKAGKKKVDDFIERVRHYSRTDLFFFADNILRNPQHYPLGIGIHDEICHLLQYGSDVGILVPRNTFKTTLVSGAFPIWTLGIDPNKRILICTAISDLAQGIVSYIGAQITQNKRLQMVFPKLKPAEHLNRAAKHKVWNKLAIEVERDMVFKEPSVLAMGLDNQCKTGNHFDLMDYDDIVTKDNAETQEKLKKAIENYQMSLNLADFETRRVYAGTRYNDADCYGDLIEKNETPFYVRKAVEETGYCWDHPSYVARVNRMKRELSPYVFACQYQNDPIAKGDAEFENEWVKSWDFSQIRRMITVRNEGGTEEEVYAEWTKTLDIHMGCDPARTDKKQSDSTVIMVCGVDYKGRVFGLEVIRRHLKTHEIVDKYIELFVKWNPKTAKVETYGGDIHVYNDIRMEMKKRGLMWTKVTEYAKTTHESGDDRIRQLTFPMSQGLIFLGPGVEWSELESEILRFPYAKHDDMVTTLAYIYSQQAKPKQRMAEKQDIGAWQRRMVTAGGGERDWMLQ